MDLRWIKWVQWGKGGMIDHGEMPRADIQKQLQMFEKEAKELLKKSGAAHVLYGVKYLDDYGYPDRVHFYLLPMTEQEFTEKTGNLRRAQVYALHAAI